MTDHDAKEQLREVATALRSRATSTTSDHMTTNPMLIKTWRSWLLMGLTVYMAVVSISVEPSLLHGLGWAWSAIVVYAYGLEQEAHRDTLNRWEDTLDDYRAFLQRPRS